MTHLVTLGKASLYAAPFIVLSIATGSWMIAAGGLFFGAVIMALALIGMASQPAIDRAVSATARIYDRQVERASKAPWS